MVYQARVYRTQGATELVIDSSGTLNAASGAINLPTNLRRGFIPFNLFGARSLSSGEAFFNFNVSATGATITSAGGLLRADSDPSLSMFSTAAKAAFVNWASGSSVAIHFPPVPIPPDLNTATAITYHIFAERASDNASNNVFDFRFWNSTNTTQMGTTGATLTTTPAEQSVSIGSTALTAHPGVWNFGLSPNAHTNNAVRVYAAWAEYDRRTS